MDAKLFYTPSWRKKSWGLARFFFPYPKHHHSPLKLGVGFVTTARGSCVAKQICEMPLPGGGFGVFHAKNGKGPHPFFGGGNWDTPVNIVHRECEFADAIFTTRMGILKLRTNIRRWFSSPLIILAILQIRFIDFKIQQRRLKYLSTIVTTSVPKLHESQGGVIFDDFPNSVGWAKNHVEPLPIFLLHQTARYQPLLWGNKAIWVLQMNAWLKPWSRHHSNLQSWKLREIWYSQILHLQLGLGICMYLQPEFT